MYLCIRDGGQVNSSYVRLERLFYKSSSFVHSKAGLCNGRRLLVTEVQALPIYNVVLMPTIHWTTSRFEEQIISGEVITFYVNKQIILTRNVV